ncbi:hypothetical protein SADUNF_Sadunf19G0049400 [Salix dunnii]|uniref:Uncharacterized protein n=1 Tax=Salix dunnii TaxID=1413687 RepID=A0A835J165_9ROSI|nr:hypothetical protein SADUNF_Sadunf19G0049400 [Salix dunnii]
MVASYGLACLTKIDKSEPSSLIDHFPLMFVIKDLVVNIQNSETSSLELRILILQMNDTNIGIHVAFMSNPNKGRRLQEKMNENNMLAPLQLSHFWDRKEKRLLGSSSNGGFRGDIAAPSLPENGDPAGDLHGSECVKSTGDLMHRSETKTPMARRQESFLRWDTMISRCLEEGKCKEQEELRQKQGMQKRELRRRMLCGGICRDSFEFHQGRKVKSWNS